MISWLLSDRSRKYWSGSELGLRVRSRRQTRYHMRADGGILACSPMLFFIGATNMDMVTRFNSLMKGFIPNDITLEWLVNNCAGVMRNGSSACHYKLKVVGGQWLLGAYGISRFTNWRFYEITEAGQIKYQWHLQEMCIAGDLESVRQMNDHNQSGFERIKAFGIEEPA